MYSIAHSPKILEIIQEILEDMPNLEGNNYHNNKCENAMEERNEGEVY